MAPSIIVFDKLGSVQSIGGDQSLLLTPSAVLKLIFDLARGIALGASTLFPPRIDFWRTTFNLSGVV